MYGRRRRRRRRRSKQKGGFFLAPFIYQNRAMTKHLKKNNIINGKGIQRPYVNKRNRLMLGKGKKQKGGFFASLIDEIWG